MLRPRKEFRKEVGVAIVASTALFLSVVWCAVSRSGARPAREVSVCARLPARLGPWVPPLDPPELGGRNVFLPGRKATSEDTGAAEKLIGAMFDGEKRGHIGGTSGGDSAERPVCVAKGTCRVQGGCALALLQQATGDYIIVREGEIVLPLGIKVVAIGDSVLVVEDGDGRRVKYRLIRRAWGND